MDKKYEKMFKELLEDKEFKGKKALKHLLWLNTVEPKFKIGDCFLVTDYGHRIFGHQVINFHAKVVEIKSWRNEEEYQYTLEMDVECEGKHTTSKCFKDEAELMFRCDDNKNILGTKKSEHADSTDVRL